MKKQLNPVVALLIVLAVAGAIGYVMWSKTQLDSGQVQLHTAKPKGK